MMTNEDVVSLALVIACSVVIVAVAIRILVGL